MKDGYFGNQDFDKRQKDQNDYRLFWDIPEYRKKMYELDPEENLDAVFNCIRDTFLQYAFSDDHKAERKDLRKLSQMLYQDRNYWALNTQIEETYFSVMADKEAARKHTMENYEKLSFLYDKMDLKCGDGKHDIVKQFARFETLTDVICNAEATGSLRSRQDLNDIVCNELVPMFTSGERCDYQFLHALQSVSKVCCAKATQWIIDYEIPEEMLKECYIFKKTIPEKIAA